MKTLLVLEVVQVGLVYGDRAGFGERGERKFSVDFKEKCKK